MRLRRTHDDVVVCDRMSLGESFSERFLGLMGRGSMDAGEGLYLKTSSIHMMFMRFPIDALFVTKPDDSGARKVVGIREYLPPWRGIVMPVRGAEASWSSRPARWSAVASPSMTLSSSKRTAEPSPR